MVRIRLRRIGKKGKAFYRVVVADQRQARDGGFIEQLGAFDPHADPPAVNLNEERARYWLSKGAQPTERVASIFKREGIVEGAVATAVRPERKVAPKAEATATAPEAPAPAPTPAAEAPVEPATDPEAGATAEAVAEPEPKAEADAEAAETPEADAAEEE